MLFYFDKYIDYRFIFTAESNRLQRCFILSSEYDEEFLQTMGLSGDISAKHMVTEMMESDGDILRRVQDMYAEGDSDPNVDDGIIEVPLLFAITALKRIPVERRDFRVVSTSHVEALSLLEGVVRVYIPERNQDTTYATVSALKDHAYATNRRVMPDITSSRAKRRRDDDSCSESSTPSTVVYAEDLNGGCGDTETYYLAADDTMKHYPPQCLRNAMPQSLRKLPSVDRQEQTRWWVDSNMTTLYDASKNYAWSSKELYQLLSSSKRIKANSPKVSSTKTQKDTKPVRRRAVKKKAPKRRRRR